MVSFHIRISVVSVSELFLKYMSIFVQKSIEKIVQIHLEIVSISRKEVGVLFDINECIACLSVRVLSLPSSNPR